MKACNISEQAQNPLQALIMRYRLTGLVNNKNGKEKTYYVLNLQNKDCSIYVGIECIRSSFAVYYVQKHRNLLWESTNNFINTEKAMKHIDGLLFNYKKFCDLLH